MAVEGLQRNGLTTWQDHERVIAICMSPSEAVYVPGVLNWLDTRSRGHRVMPRNTEPCESISELSASVVRCVFALTVDVIVAGSRVLESLVRRMPRVHHARLDRGRFLGWNRIDCGHFTAGPSSVLTSDARYFQHGNGQGRMTFDNIRWKNDGGNEAAGQERLQTLCVNKLRPGRLLSCSLRFQIAGGCKSAKDGKLCGCNWKSVWQQ
jgi:hypothetical protein